MAIEITYKGNDDGVLAQVCTDAALVIDASGSTQNAIESAYGAAAVVQDYFGNDLNEIERLAAASAPPYVFKLDDDGTLAAALGHAWLQTVAPDYLAFSHVTTGVVAGSSNTAASAHALADDGSIPRTAGVIVVLGEMEVTAAPPLVEILEGKIIATGIGAIITAAGVPVASLSASIDTTFVTPTWVAPTVVGEFVFNGLALATVTSAAVSMVGKRVGLYLDGTTGHLGWSFEGDKGYIVGASVGVGQRVTPGLFLQGDAFTPVGKTVAGHFVKNAAEMTCVYPAGAVDMYGVAV